MSNAPQDRPSASCTAGAVGGSEASGVLVATTTRSIEAGSAPASSSAARPASIASPVVEPPMRRSRIPVRSTIHASEVSSVASRSELVTTFEGRLAPTPATRMPTAPHWRVVTVLAVTGWVRRRSRAPQPCHGLAACEPLAGDGEQAHDGAPER